MFALVVHSILFFALSVFLLVNFFNSTYGQDELPKVFDGNLKIELVSSDLNEPTSIAFLGADDFLVNEKNNGTVQRVINGVTLHEPLLDVNVNAEEERGMLGIAVAKNNSTINDKTYVFLYYTEAKDQDGGEPIGNRLYRYELANDKLINPKLLLDLPYKPGPSHNGGLVTIGPDSNVYVVVGDLYSHALNNDSYSTKNLGQNVINGKLPDGRSGILHVKQDGKLVSGKGILGDEDPLKFYYAYGIRNSFGMAFDPLSGKLWDTENGGEYDEINLVEPGFNSGWKILTGKASRNINFSNDELVDFEGKGKYSDPEFSWITQEGGFRTAPTALVFFNSDKYGPAFRNDMFVADTRGNIYHFDLNKDRTQLVLGGPLADQVADNASEIQGSIFAKFPNIITDLDVGPDGYLYVTAYNKNGTIFKIVPSKINQ